MSAGRPCRAAGRQMPQPLSSQDPPLTRKRPGLPADAVHSKTLTRRIEQAVGARAAGPAAHRQGIERARVVAVEQRGVERIAPGEDAAVRAARGLLPFELGREPPPEPGLGRKPGGIGPRVVVGDQHHRMVLPPRRRPALGPRMAAGALEGMDQPVAAPGLGIDIGDTVARGVHKCRIVGIGDEGAGDEEASQRPLPARAFAVVPAALPCTGVAVGCLVEPVAVLPFGCVGAGDEGAGGNLDQRRNGHVPGVGGACHEHSGDGESGDAHGTRDNHRTRLVPGRRARESQ